MAKRRRTSFFFSALYNPPLFLLSHTQSSRSRIESLMSRARVRRLRALEIKGSDECIDFLLLSVNSSRTVLVVVFVVVDHWWSTFRVGPSPPGLAASLMPCFERESFLFLRVSDGALRRGVPCQDAKLEIEDSDAHYVASSRSSSRV